MLVLKKTLKNFPQVVDNKFEGTLNVLVHNASQIFVPDGDKRHPYEIGAPRDTNFGNLLKTEGKTQHSFINSL